MPEKKTIKTEITPKEYQLLQFIRNKFKFGNSSTTRKRTVSKYLQLAADKAIECSPVDFGVPWMGGKRTAEE